MAPFPEWSSDFVHTVDPVAESKAIRVACIFPVDACNKDINFFFNQKWRPQDDGTFRQIALKYVM